MSFKSNTKSVSTVMITIAAVVVVLLSGEAHGRAPAVLSRGDPCRKYDNPALCRSLTKGQKSPVAATQAVVKRLLAETAVLKRTADKLAKKYPQVIDVCSENYDSALDSLRTCLSDVAKRDKFSYNSQMSGVITDFYTCDDTFVEMGFKSPLAKTNSRLTKIADTALYLAKLW